MRVQNFLDTGQRFEVQMNVHEVAFRIGPREMINFLQVQKVQKREIRIIIGVLGHAKQENDIFNVLSGLLSRILETFCQK